VHLHGAVLGRELDRVGQQVPRNLPQARGVAVDPTDERETSSSSSMSCACRAALW